MNSRRKFLLQGGMATTALIASKPFKTIAGVCSPITGYGTNDNRVIFLHTSDLHNANYHQLISHIAELKRSAGNVVLLNACAAIAENATALNYDASISQNNAVSDAVNNYRIIYKGNIKIGVVTAIASDNNLFSTVNTLASYLKKEKNCHLVVCLSTLGYKHKHGVDDLNLAVRSGSLDIIIGGDANNRSNHPVVVLNKDNAEVIIDHAADTALALGRIEIAFDEGGQKRNIAFTEAPGKKLIA